ncbi:hypothetical protein VN0741_03080 [Helicobacter pylori]|nr:hypothetical protein VN1236_14870 [Helicobacter pylori]GHS27692.1 hypothetical protein VN1155_02230 [Helicobacter pylori]
MFKGFFKDQTAKELDFKDSFLKKLPLFNENRAKKYIFKEFLLRSETASF